jgi:hypothetical protein
MANGVRVRASVACYHCGHRSGDVEAEPDCPLAAGVFLPAGQPGARVELRGRRLRCARCGGPTYFDEVRPVRVRQPRLVTWRGRGRPPKNAIRITVPPQEGVKRRRPVVLYALVVDGDPESAAELLHRQAV